MSCRDCSHHELITEKWMLGDVVMDWYTHHCILEERDGRRGVRLTNPDGICKQYHRGQGRLTEAKTERKLEWKGISKDFAEASEKTLVVRRVSEDEILGRDT